MMVVFDLIGTVAFAVVGASVGVQKRLDVFGITVFALATALGGGVVRDLVIGNTPPLAFRNPFYVSISVVSAIVVMLVYHHIKKFNMTILVCDAIGLGAFAAAGSKMAIDFEAANLLTVTFLAVVTAVGGGVIRDIFAREIPSVFRKEIYAVAALAGSFCFYLAYPYIEQDAAMYLCFAVTTIFRIVAMNYNWDLPVVHSKKI